MKKLLVFSGAAILALAVLACQLPMSNGFGQSEVSLLSRGAAVLSSFVEGTLQPISGATFTTTPDGSVVNENVWYESKLEVYLDGGPGPNAPQTAAGLPDGMYVFQVTDPSGKILLSEDPAKCRVVEVVDGVIVGLVEAEDLNLTEGYTITLKGNKEESFPCHIQDEPDGVAGPSGRHDTNTDIDHGPPAIVVQLMPFFDTPNPGGVYKAWMIPLERYEENGGELEKVPVPVSEKNKTIGYERDPGFGPDQRYIKTDNFKVKKKGPQMEPPLIIVKKFHDKNFNGVFDDGQDEWITGWYVGIADPFGTISYPLPTQVEYLAGEAGTYVVLEDTPVGTVQTASILDGIPLDVDTEVLVDVVADYAPNNDQEVHTVVYGNVGLGEVSAYKYYDRNGNGEADEGEPAIPGWKFELTGTLANGDPFGPEYGTTGDDGQEPGSVKFTGLLPGDYTITELMAADYQTEAITSFNFTVESTLNGAELSGGSFTFSFANYCEGLADFDTKGYWHNKNGLTELINSPDGNNDGVPDVIDYVNGLAPYSGPSPYFDNGDEPFDGEFSDGYPVAAMFGDGIFQGVEVAAQDSWQAEVSQFLVDPNAGSSEYYHQEQLAQQLLAFIFNTYFRLYSPDAAILVDGEWVSASGFITESVSIWANGSAEEIVARQELLTSFNEADPSNPDSLVKFIHSEPCPVVYP
jgi:hypothetical protein